MYQKFAKVTLLMAMFFVFTGCGKNQAATEPVETQETTSQTDAASVIASSAASETESEKVSTQDTQSIDPADYVGYYNNDADDIMEISQAADGSYTIEIELYRLWGCDKTVLTADGDKLVFDSEDSSGQPIKGAVYPDGNQLVFELLDADWEYFKTGDKFTGFTLADTSEPLLNGAGEYLAALAVDANPEDWDMSTSGGLVQEYSFEDQTMIITASFWYAPLDEAGNTLDYIGEIETTTARLPLDDAYLYTTGGEDEDEPFDSFEDFKTYLDEVNNSGLGLGIKIEDNKVVSIGICS